MSELDLNNTDFETPIWRKWWAITIAGLVLAGLIVAGILLFTRDAGLNFSIEFKDVSGLDIGSGIYLNGLQVGKVRDLNIPASGGKTLVEVNIDPVYRQQMRQGSVFKIVIPAATGSVTARVISMEVITPTSPIIEQDQVLKGASNDIDALIQIIKIKGMPLGEQIKKFVNDYLRLGDLRINTKFTGKKTSRSFVLESGLAIPQDLFFSSILPDGEMWIRSDSSTESTRAATIQGEFSDPGEAVWDKTTLQFSSKGNLFWTDFNYIETFHGGYFGQVSVSEDDNNWFDSIWNEIINCVGGDTTACEATVREAIKPIIQTAQGVVINNLGVSLSVEMPGTITETNASSYKGNAATWNFTGAEIDKGITVMARSRRYNVISFSVVGLILAGIIVALLIVFRRKAIQQESAASIID